MVDFDGISNRLFLELQTSLVCWQAETGYRDGSDGGDALAIV